MSLPAWSEAFAAGALDDVRALPLAEPSRDWAWGGATGKGVKVAIIDSGVQDGHPRVGRIEGSVRFEPDEDEESGYRVVEGPHDDVVGHGTACAGIIRALAPEAEIWSVRVLGANLKGPGSMFLAGIRWAVDNGMDVANLSLSTGRDTWYGPLHEAADEAFFKKVLLVCAANNVPGPTYPTQYASVVSVAAHLGTDPYEISYNPHPPVEFGAVGIDVDVAWLDSGSITATGNSFATPHVAGLSALLLSKHPGLTPFQVKAVLQAVAVNASHA